MPIKLPRDLPAKEALDNENIFTITDTRASTQDIRPLRIAILNLMPKKVITETQLCRVLSNTSLQVELTLLYPYAHKSAHTSDDYIMQFYRSTKDVMDEKFDGLIITGAPVEKMEFDEVSYWDEIVKLNEWSKTNVYSTLYICWAAFAGLYMNYGIKKVGLEKKLSGVYEHKLCTTRHELVRGFDEKFYVPHSRWSEPCREQIEACGELEVIARSDEAGIYLVGSKDKRTFYITGHSEYDFDTLDAEYRRDKAKNPDTPIPAHYYPDDNPRKKPLNVWRAHSNLLFSNWLNYFVYQETPYDINKIKEKL